MLFGFQKRKPLLKRGYTHALENALRGFSGADYRPAQPDRCSNLSVNSFMKCS